MYLECNVADRLWLQGDDGHQCDENDPRDAGNHDLDKISLKLNHYKIYLGKNILNIYQLTRITPTVVASAMSLPPLASTPSNTNANTPENILYFITL